MCPPDMDVSRRGLLGAVGAAPLQPVSLSSPAHDPVVLASAWFVTGADVTRLTHRWREFENKMLRDPVWAALSREERRFTSSQVRLTQIDDLKEGAQDRQHASLEKLVLAPTNNISGALAKLAVVMGLMIPDDYPHCYQLIADTAETLAALECPHCHKRQAHSGATSLLVEAAKVWSFHTQV